MWEIKQGDALNVLKTMPEQSVHCCVTSPPYFGLRDYGVEGQIGLERTPEEYVDKLVQVFREVRRVLRDDGTLWLNLGDSYNGSGGAGGDYNPGGLKEGQPKYPGRKVPGLKPKDLIGTPWMVALALRNDGWYLRCDIIWEKVNCLPESATDRPTRAHEYIFLLSKSPKYYYDHEAIKEPVTSKQSPQAVSFKRKGSKREQPIPGQAYGTYRPNRKDTPLRPTRNKRSVWTVPTQPFPEAHFAVYPPALITPCILAGCPVGGTVLDPFAGSGTTLLVATQHHRKSIGIELNPEYIEIAKRRLNSVQLKLVME